MTTATRVLFVDDDSQMCDLARILLARRGYEVQTRNTFDDACQALEDAPWDVMITDATLDNQTSGLDLIRRLADRGATTRCLVLSGDRGLRKPEGAQAVLTKPVTGQVLIDAVERAMEGG